MSRTRLSRPAAVLLDVDGTLVDSTAGSEEVWRTVAAEFDAPAEDLLRGSHGMRDADVVAIHFPAEVRAAVALRVLELDLEMADLVSPCPGAAELLERVSRWPWAVVTSGGLALTRRKFAACGLPWPRVAVCAEDVHRGKPDPEGYSLAARRLGAAPSTCWVVEDAPAGVAAGADAGMTVIAVAATHPAGVLARADLIVAGLPEVSARLDSPESGPPDRVTSPRTAR